MWAVAPMSRSYDKPCARRKTSSISFAARKTIFSRTISDLAKGRRMSSQATADIGLSGLAVMGENLALNIADHGFKVAAYNRTTAVMRDFVKHNPNTPGGLVPCETMKEFVAAIKKPRKAIILVKA